MGKPRIKAAPFVSGAELFFDGKPTQPSITLFRGVLFFFGCRRDPAHAGRGGAGLGHGRLKPWFSRLLTLFGTPP